MTVQEFYTIDEMAEKLGVKNTTLVTYIARGEFPEPVKLGKFKVFPRSMIEEYLDRAMKQSPNWRRAHLKSAHWRRSVWS